MAFDDNWDPFFEPSWMREPEEPEQFEGDVYFDPRTNRFIQVRKQTNNKLHCGEFCEYYEDAQTCLLTQTLSRDYLDGLVKVEDIDKFDKAEYDGIGWCIKGTFKELDDLVPRRRR